MKKIVKKILPLLATMAIAIVAVVLTACSQQSTKKSSSNASSTSKSTQTVSHKTAKKTLIVYYSLTNNTASLAKKIHQVSGADIVRINAKKTYPSDDNDAINARVKREKGKRQFDSLNNVPRNLDKYDTVLVGFPIWSNDIAYPVQSFLSQNSQKLAGKQVVPFSTSSMAAPSAIRQTVRTIKSLAPKADIQKGLNLTSGDTSTSRIKSWLNSSVKKTNQENGTKTAINVKVGRRNFKGYLNNSVAARDLAKQLPLKQSFKNFASGYPEKYSSKTLHLSTQGMSGDNPKSGDIDYNSNNHNLFLYFGHVGHFDELHNIGHVTSGGYPKALQQQKGNFTVEISAAK